MLRLVACMSMFYSIAISQTLPYNRVTQAQYAAAAVVPATSIYSNAPGRNPLLGGYNYPYYNPTANPVPIVSYSNNRGKDGSYSYSYASADGKQAQESGFLKDAYVDTAGNPQGTQVVKGSYAYISPEGTPIQVSYVADEYGFRSSGVHIPADGKDVLPTVALAVVVGVTSADVGFQPFQPQSVYQQQQLYTTEPIPIIRQEHIQNPDGSYKWSYETGNGITAEELGYVKNLGVPEQEVQTAQGQYQYTAPDGQIIQLKYVADENGFQPQGAHIPTPPPIPQDIQKALDYLATLPSQNPENGVLGRQ
ncbi:unnamed protein product [Parnassius mnemosyne]|uniref:Uncharacterized protein n=1 Tax=Parnassius mnemosyne TaxID=213953 RepID=A0AAV1MAI3_9NEOP